jgi:hypothetical protein
MVVIGPQDQITGGYEQVGRANQTLKLEVIRIHQELESGWDGLREAPDLRDAAELALRTKQITLHQGTTSWNEVIELFNEEFGERLLVDAAIREKIHAACSIPFLQVVEELKLGTVVERMARELGLSWCLLDNGTAYLASADSVARARADSDERAVQHRNDLYRLQKPVEGDGRITVTDFLDSLPRTYGLRIMPEEEVWESNATLTLSPGSTLQQALDQLRPLGFRWAVRNGSIYVVR